MARKNKQKVIIEPEPEPEPVRKEPLYPHQSGFTPIQCPTCFTVHKNDRCPNCGQPR